MTAREYERQAKKDAATVLQEHGFNHYRIAAALGVARQTVRRWLIPGERVRHNAVIHARQGQQRKQLPPSPTKGARSRVEKADIESRIFLHRKRIEQAESLARQAG